MCFDRKHTLTQKLKFRGTSTEAAVHFVNCTKCGRVSQSLMTEASQKKRIADLTGQLLKRIASEYRI